MHVTQKRDLLYISDHRWKRFRRNMTRGSRLCGLASRREDWLWMGASASLDSLNLLTMDITCRWGPTSEGWKGQSCDVGETSLECTGGQELPGAHPLIRSWIRFNSCFNLLQTGCEDKANHWRLPLEQCLLRNKRMDSTNWYIMWVGAWHQLKGGTHNLSSTCSESSGWLNTSTCICLVFVLKS